MSTATKAQSQKIFEKLKTKAANKICFDCVWQWDQLRLMKVGGNESATKYFQSHGGSAALASKDGKVKYTSNAAVKYKEELKKRAAADAAEFPEEVSITDILSPTFPNGSVTPLGDPGDDFFSSWDKPAIKRPSNPPSRAQTPVISRTASPFLNANGNAGRPKTPLNGTEADSSAPAASRTTSSSALRKTTTTSGPRKANILGAKKTQKLGAKKLGGDALDFEAAEKKAKEEAERIAKLGYDPDAEDNTTETTITSSLDKPKIASPIPIAPAKASFGASRQPEHQRTPSELERLDMGMSRLGFGQVGGAKGGSVGTPRKMGFGSVGASKVAEDDDSQKYAREKFGAQKGISSDEFFGRAAFDPSATAEAKTRLQGFEGATSISSNAYFGRPEDDGPGDDGNYGDLEGAARDFVRKFGVTAGDDLENLTHVVGEGASRLQSAIRSYLNN